MKDLPPLSVGRFGDHVMDKKEEIGTRDRKKKVPALVAVLITIEKLSSHSGTSNLNIVSSTAVVVLKSAIVPSSLLREITPFCTVFLSRDMIFFYFLFFF